MSRFAPLLVPITIAGCGQAGETAQQPVEPACNALELAEPDGRCVRPGIPSAGCAPGFAHDGEYGCDPILPPEPCPPGLVAVPGDSACRKVMECGQGPWGALPVDSNTVYVDGAYSGALSDGSAARPWTNIAAAVTAAAPGGLIAVAAGSYAENVVIFNKPVRLWGICPEQVEIVATGQSVGGCPPTAVCVKERATGTELGGVALRGQGDGLNLSGSEDVVVDRVWVHDAALRGINVQHDLGPTSLRVTGSLVEQNADIGLFVSGSVVVVEDTVVRATAPNPLDQLRGRGIDAQLRCVGIVCDPATRSTTVVRRSLVEQNHEVGIAASGSDVTVEGTVVRHTLPHAADQAFGRGIALQLACAPAGCDPSSRSLGVVRGSLVEQSHEIGLLVAGSDATVESTVVRATQPRAGDQRRGRGISIQLGCIPSGCDPSTRSSALIRSSLVEQNLDIGLLVAGSDATVESTVVRATSPRSVDGAFGDGISVFSDFAPASVAVVSVRVHDSARAGVSSFGAFASLAGTRIECAAFDIAAEIWSDSSAVFDDLGGNQCGCTGATRPCQAASIGLAPPEPLE